MSHPFEMLSPRTRLVLFLIFQTATIVVGYALVSIGETFANKVGPGGERFDIVKFEFAGTPQHAEFIKQVWQPDGVEAARKNTLLDYLFLLCYSNAIALGVVWALGKFRRFYFGKATIAVGVALAWGQWLAALLDAVENGCLLRVLAAPAISPYPELAFWCAAVKFALVGLGIIYTLAGLVVVMPIFSLGKAVTED